MTPPAPPDSSPIDWKFRHWLGMWAGGLFLGGFLSQVALLAWPGDIEGPEFFFFAGLPLQVIGFMAAIFIGFRVLGAQLERDVGFDIRLTDLRMVPLAFLNLVALSLAVLPLSEWLDAPDQTQVQLELFSNASSAALFIGVILIVGFAPMYEEVLFRGVLQRALARSFGRWPTFLLTAFTFGIIHIVTVDFSDPSWPAAGAVTVVTIFLLGIVLSWVADGRLGRPIVFHSTHNLIVLAATYAESAGLLDGV